MPCDDEKPMLDVKDLAFSYTDEETLKCIEMLIKPGEFVALMGPNGSGKTTLMRCINKVMKINNGSVNIDGDDILSMTMEDIAKICTTVPADTPLDFALTVRDFVSLGRTPFINSLWWESDEDEAIVDKAMWDLGITKYSERRLHELSSGERARVLLAKGVVQTPKLMLVDEPSAHLDIKYKVQVMEILKDLTRRTGLTVLIASHDINLLTRFCDRIMLLSKGKILDCGLAKDVVTKESIREVFGIEVELVECNDTLYILPTGSTMNIQ
ncbi:MAG: ABC transporter ATP-binding protein [Thermoplasmata archaeon]|jgi:iron complex transport system ATP-binding protein|nr:ABC transporter ATP-binding protein [Thermoplasmata archaeon]